MKAFVIILLLLGLYSCNFSTEQTDTVTSKNNKKNETVSNSSKEVSGNHKNELEYILPDIPDEIKEFPIEKIIEIHKYLSIERWNDNGDIGMRNGTDYEKAAKLLNIPVSKLKAADTFYHYTVLKSMTNWSKSFFDTISEIEPSYYNSIRATAYNGIATFYGEIVLEGSSKETEINTKEKASEIAENLTNKLPDWITGYKLYWTTYKDTYLETVEDVDIAFLWIRGSNSIYTMDPQKSTYSGRNPIENDEWASSKWNNMEKVKHPTYYYIRVSNS